MINQGRALPLTLRVVGVGIVLVAVVKIMQHFPESYAIPIAIALSFLAPMIWFSSTILTINLETKEIHLGTWIMGLKTGRPESFDHIEKIFINEVKTIQKMQRYGTGGVYEKRDVEYRAFIKLDNEEKYFLISHRSEKKVEKRVADIKKKLGID